MPAAVITAALAVLAIVYTSILAMIWGGENHALFCNFTFKKLILLLFRLNWGL
jgi:hypothetical protein